MTRETNKPEGTKTYEDVAIARNGFINEVYPHLFGVDFTSDSTVEITSLNVTSLLMQYEAVLMERGVLNIEGANQSNGQA